MRKAVVLVLVVFCLQQAAQIAVTPFNEGMDEYAHLAYVIFVSKEGRAPKLVELSLQARLAETVQIFPAPDTTTGDKYRAWSQQTWARREELKAAYLAPLTTSDYGQPNYQSQHPVLYYWLMSLIYPGLRHFSLDKQAYGLALASTGLAALGLLGIYFTFRLYFDEAASVLALLSVAWYPNLMVFLGRVTNDTLAFAFMAWCIYVCVRPRRTLRDVLAAGVLLALACYTKTYAFTLLPVYLASAAFGLSPEGKTMFYWKRLGAAVLVASVGIGSLLLVNYLTTGYGLLLVQIRDTTQVSALEVLKRVWRIDPVWFLGGMVRGFWWSGYWSFVSPGLLYYAPLVALGYLLIKRPRNGRGPAQFLALKTLWPHYLAFGSFLLALIWNAAVFRVRSELAGDVTSYGNEGWYMDVLVGCAFAIGLVLTADRMTAVQFRRCVAGLAVFFLIWNLIARLALLMFWSGQVSVVGRLRGVNWAEVWLALPSALAWQNALSLPGVIAPVALTFGLPLLASLAISFYLFRKFAVTQKNLV